MHQNASHTFNIHVSEKAQPEIDYHRDTFFITRVDSIYEAFGPSIAEMEKKVCALEEKIKVIKGSSSFRLDAADMCLVPSVKILAKFKVSDFEKYKGVSCLKTHIRCFCRKMNAYFEDEKLLLHFFQNKLSGASLEWYMQVECTHIRTRKELAKAFLKHYQYNKNMAHNRT